MTREEAIRILKYNSNVIHQTINGKTDPKEVEAFDMAIKSLEQESVLDKIRERVELEKLGYPPSAGYYKAIMKVLQILDKYKSEIEPQESDTEKRKPCTNYEDGCEEWAGCPCVYYKAESEGETK